MTRARTVHSYVADAIRNTWGTRDADHSCPQLRVGWWKVRIIIRSYSPFQDCTLVSGTNLLGVNTFRTAVPFLGQTTWDSNGCTQKRDCSSKRVKSQIQLFANRSINSKRSYYLLVVDFGGHTHHPLKTQQKKRFQPSRKGLPLLCGCREKKNLRTPIRSKITRKQKSTAVPLGGVVTVFVFFPCCLMSEFLGHASAKEPKTSKI